MKKQTYKSIIQGLEKDKKEVSKSTDLVKMIPNI